MPQILIKNGDGFPWQREARELRRVDEETGVVTPATRAEARALYKSRRLAVRAEELDRAGENVPARYASLDAMVEAEIQRAESMANVHGQVVGVYPDDHIFSTGSRNPRKFKAIQLTEAELVHTTGQPDRARAEHALRQKNERNLPRFLVQGVDYDTSNFLVPRKAKHRLAAMPETPDRDMGRIQPRGTAGTYALRASGLEGEDGELETYNTISEWQTAHKDDDLTGTSTCKLVCYRDWASGLDEGATISLTGWAGTTSTAYPWIIGRNDAINRHASFVLASSGVSDYDAILYILHSWARAENIVVSAENITSDVLVRGIAAHPSTSATEMYVLRCVSILNGGATTTYGGFVANAHDTRTDKTIFANCIAIGGYNGFYLYGVAGEASQTHVMACTAIGATTGIYTDTRSASSRVINCLADGNTSDYAETGSYAGTTSYIATSDGTATGTGSKTSVDPVYLVEGHPLGTAHDDYRIHPDDVDVFDDGTDLSGDATFPISLDIDERERSATPTIGASEVWTFDELADRAEKSYTIMKYAKE